MGMATSIPPRLTLSMVPEIGSPWGGMSFTGNEVSYRG